MSDSIMRALEAENAELKKQNKELRRKLKKKAKP